MKAIINDIAFQYKYDTVESAQIAFHNFLDICRKIESEEITNVKIIESDIIDKYIEVAPNYTIIQLVQQFKTREQRSYLLSILTNRGRNLNISEKCIIDGKESHICSCAKNNILISLLSSTIFASDNIIANVNDKTIELRNISKNEHIYFYGQILGIRKYKANSKKHKPNRENNYGKGKIASRMDLSDDEAQKLLNKAVYINNRLYAKKDGNYYAFQHEGGIDYHGYNADDLQDNIKRQLDKTFV